MQYVIGLVGKPAVGKSTLGRKLAKELNFSHIDKDEFRRFFISEIKFYNEGFHYDTNPQIKSINRVIMPMADNLIKELLDAGQNIIIDGYGKRKKSRDHAKKVVNEFDVKIILVYLKANENIMIERLSKREDGDNWVISYYSKWKNEFDVPNSNEADYFIESDDIIKVYERIKNIVN